jgi:predicted amidophosphoribosyltransferase
MTKIQFADLLFQLEELLAEVDFHRRKINNCKQCRGWREDDYRNMCPDCLKALYQEFQCMDSLARDEEFKAVMRTIREAIAEDNTGELAQIMALARRATEN